MNESDPIFGDPRSEIIFAYTRKQAVEDGVQVDVTATAQEAGIALPVFLTRAVFEQFVIDSSGSHQWPVRLAPGRSRAPLGYCRMLLFAILRSRPGVERIPVALYVRNDNRAARLIKLVATCGPVDMHDPRPGITVMMPEED